MSEDDDEHGIYGALVGILLGVVLGFLLTAAGWDRWVELWLQP